MLVALVNAIGFGVVADIVTDANSGMIDAIRADDDPAPLAARNLAILHTAIYDSINAITKGGSVYFARATPAPGASAPAAAAAAAHQVSSLLYPDRIGLFDATFAAQLAALSPGTNRDAGVAVGLSVATAILNWREADGASLSVPYIPNPAPGFWQRTPPFFRPPDLPQWPYVTPFALTNGAQFRPAGPPALDSTEWADAYHLLQAIGATNSATRTAEQTVIARFWSDFSYTTTPPGHWNRIAQTVAATMGNSLTDNARLFALLNVAMADGGIAAWDAKYTFNFWRPVTAIEAGDTDGNSATLGDPAWVPLLVTPAFPEYISGHSTFSGAAATVLAAFYGTDAIGFSIGADALPGVIRSFNGFWETAEECGMSRIYGGIHYPFSDDDGLATGKAIGNYVFSHFMVPIAGPARVGGLALDPGGDVRIQVSGSPNQRYVLETSADLRNWAPAVTNTVPFTYVEPVGTEGNGRFFRASLATP